MNQPKYKNIANFISKQISQGRWKPNDKVPSEPELAEKFDASRMTARKAVEELVIKGLLERVPSVGTFVARPKIQSSLFEIKNIKDEILERGNIHRMDVLSKMIVSPNKNIDEVLGSQNTQAFRVVILHYENEIPIQLEERFINTEIAPNFMTQDFSKITVSEYLSSLLPLTNAKIKIEAITPSKILKNQLQLDEDIPCLKLTRITFSNGIASTYSVFYSPSNRFNMAGELTIQ
jgi:GntR family histidine utilization transcriptional repressor